MNFMVYESSHEMPVHQSSPSQSGAVSDGVFMNQKDIWNNKGWSAENGDIEFSTLSSSTGRPFDMNEIGREELSNVPGRAEWFATDYSASTTASMTPDVAEPPPNEEWLKSKEDIGSYLWGSQNDAATTTELFLGQKVQPQNGDNEYSKEDHFMFRSDSPTGATDEGDYTATTEGQGNINFGYIQHDGSTPEAPSFDNHYDTGTTQGHRQDMDGYIDVTTESPGYAQDSDQLDFEREAVKKQQRDKMVDAILGGSWTGDSFDPTDGNFVNVVENEFDTDNIRILNDGINVEVMDQEQGQIDNGMKVSDNAAGNDLTVGNEGDENYGLYRDANTVFGRGPTASLDYDGDSTLTDGNNTGKVAEEDNEASIQQFSIHDIQDGENNFGTENTTPENDSYEYERDYVEVNDIDHYQTKQVDSYHDPDEFPNQDETTGDDAFMTTKEMEIHGDPKQFAYQGGSTSDYPLGSTVEMEIHHDKKDLAYREVSSVGDVLTTTMEMKPKEAADQFEEESTTLSSLGTPPHTTELTTSSEYGGYYQPSGVTEAYENVQTRQDTESRETTSFETTSAPPLTFTTDMTSPSARDEIKTTPAVPKFVKSVTQATGKLTTKHNVSEDMPDTYDNGTTDSLLPEASVSRQNISDMANAPASNDLSNIAHSILYSNNEIDEANAENPNYDGFVPVAGMTPDDENVDEQSVVNSEVENIGAQHENIDIDATKVDEGNVIEDADSVMDMNKNNESMAVSGDTTNLPDKEALDVESASNDTLPAENDAEDESRTNEELEQETNDEAASSHGLLGQDAAVVQTAVKQDGVGFADANVPETNMAIIEEHDKSPDGLLARAVNDDNTDNNKKPSAMMADNADLHINDTSLSVGVEKTAIAMDVGPVVDGDPGNSGNQDVAGIIANNETDNEDTDDNNNGSINVALDDDIGENTGDGNPAAENNTAGGENIVDSEASNTDNDGADNADESTPITAKGELNNNNLDNNKNNGLPGDNKDGNKGDIMSIDELASLTGGKITNTGDSNPSSGDVKASAGENETGVVDTGTIKETNYATQDERDGGPVDTVRDINEGNEDDKEQNDIIPGNDNENSDPARNEPIGDHTNDNKNTQSDERPGRPNENYTGVSNMEVESSNTGDDNNPTLPSANDGVVGNVVAQSETNTENELNLPHNKDQVQDFFQKYNHFIYRAKEEQRAKELNKSILEKVRYIKNKVQESTYTVWSHCPKRDLLCRTGCG